MTERVTPAFTPTVPFCSVIGPVNGSNVPLMMAASLARIALRVAWVTEGPKGAMTTKWSARLPYQKWLFQVPSIAALTSMM